jgi:hypothetical protein
LEQIATPSSKQIKSISLLCSLQIYLSYFYGLDAIVSVDSINGSEEKLVIGGVILIYG